MLQSCLGDWGCLVVVRSPITIPRRNTENGDYISPQDSKRGYDDAWGRWGLTYLD
jgi:hypothetical protein